jgi:hypothetical protein
MGLGDVADDGHGHLQRQPGFARFAAGGRD